MDEVVSDETLKDLAFHYMKNRHQPLGSEGNPVILKTYSEDRMEKLVKICQEHDLKFVIGLEDDEDITDLERAVKERTAPFDTYAACPCGSGVKYKFCCLKKPISFDV